VSTSHPIRVLCVDDHRIVREGIALIINQQSDMEVVATASSGEESVQMFRRHRPDVTLMDLQMGAMMNGVEAIRRIRGEDVHAKVVVLTMYIGDEDIHQALSAGAVAYLYKNTISDDLIRLIREVHSGQDPVMRPEIQASLKEWAARPRITPREVEVLELISEGMRDREIARVLGISDKTAYVHVKNILFKLGAKDRTAAVRAAVRRGILHMV